MISWEPGDDIVRIGRWRADPRADEIRADGAVVKLEPIKMRLLLALAERPGEVILTQELLDRVWGDVVVTSNSVYQGVALLRRVLGDDGDESSYIETLPRKGYRLVAPVSRQPRDETSTTSPGALSEFSPLAGGARSKPAADSLPPLPIAVPPPAGLPVTVAVPAEVPVPVSSGRGLSRRSWLVAGASAGAAGVVAALGWRYMEDRAPQGPVHLAVMPFTDRTPGAGEAALSLGLSLDIVRALQRHPAIRVTASESAFAAAGKPLEDVARQLQVGWVLVGELVQAATRVRVDVKLIRWPGSSTRWQRSFDEPMATLALLGDAIAVQAVQALRLTPVQYKDLPGATEAYELYVLGDHAWRPKTPEAFEKARVYFGRGIEADPGFARNYVGLGWTWLGQMTFGAGVDFDEAYARATPLFDKALRLDPELAEALTAQGVLRVYSGRFDEARALFQRVLASHPGYAAVHQSAGICEFEDGWPQRAVPHLQRAAELNPLSEVPHDRLGLAFVASGKLPDAEAAYRKAIALEPAHPNGYWGLGFRSYADGSLDQAVLNFRAALQREARRPFIWLELAYIYLDIGAPAHAAEAFARTAELLPLAKWPNIVAGFGWLIRPDRGEPPAAFALTAEAMPEDGSVVDAMMIRAMASLPIDGPLLQRALDLIHGSGRDGTLNPLWWQMFFGFHTSLDLATLYGVLGNAERKKAYIDNAQEHLDRIERQGNVSHALRFHRARMLALRGEREGALDALTAAVAAGSRRGWRLRMDPAFAPLRDSPRFAASLASIDRENARQRAALNL